MKNITTEDIRRALETITGEPVDIESIAKTVREMLLPTEAVATENERRKAKGLPPLLGIDSAKAIHIGPVILRKSDTGTSRLCPECGSPLKKKWLFFNTGRCVNKACDNYFNALPTFRSDIPMPEVKPPMKESLRERSAKRAEYGR